MFLLHLAAIPTGCAIVPAGITLSNQVEKIITIANSFVLFGKKFGIAREPGSNDGTLWSEVAMN